MRFFTNDSKDDRDDAKDVDVQERSGYQPEPQAETHPEAVSSDPVPVPQQRANSPWSSTPSDTAGDVTATDEHGSHRRDDGTGPADDTDRVDDTDRTNRVDEALDDRGTFDDPQVSDAAHAPSDSDSDSAADRLAGSHVYREGDDRTDDDRTDDRTDDDRTDAGHVHEDPTPPDHAVADTTPDATAPDATAPDATGREEPALKDEGGFDDPKAVDPATEEPLTSHDDPPVAAAAAATTTAAATAGDSKPGDSKPGEVAAPEMTRLFGDDSQGFQDRWRDVQLRFVDSPKEATAEAAKLVDEAVDRLTANLKSQKDRFGGESTDDTEKLRVQLRGYRDVLNRIIAL
jgi:hypothetical protein